VESPYGRRNAGSISRATGVLCVPASFDAWRATYDVRPRKSRLRNVILLENRSAFHA
jgi:hypothetical protein